MKKTVLFAAIAALLASCANEETMQMANKGNAIGFDSFVGKVTRAGDVTTENLESFYVYGGATANQFDGTNVTKSSGSWTYSPAEYWESGKTYKFAAVAPQVTASYDLTTLSVQNYEAGANDLIVATANATAAASDNQPVQFTFKHALAKVQFSFKNGSETVDVSNVKVSGINSVANLAVTAGASGTEITWSEVGTSKQYPAENALYLLPQNVTESMVLTFTYEEENYSVKLSEAISSVPSWINGQSYSYNVNLGSNETIEFSADVTAWTSTDANLYPETSDEVVEPEPEPDPTPGPEEPGEDVEDEVTKYFDCIADTWIREDNTSKTNESADKVEIRMNGNDDDGYKIFAGLFGFNYEVPAGMEVETANIRLVTERWKGCPINVWSYSNDFNESSACWDTESGYVATAMSGNTIANFTPKAERNKALGSDEIGANDNKYKSLEEWTNSIDVTDYVKGLDSNKERVNILLTPQDNNNVGQNCFYTKETGDVTNAKDASLTFSKSDLIPQLTVVFKKKAN